MSINELKGTTGTGHTHWVESITHRSPPNHWAFCSCGWHPPKVDNERVHGDDSDKAVIAHIEAEIGKLYVAPPMR